jgi:hypothetical protein
MNTCSECACREATHPYELCRYCYNNPVIRSQYRWGKGVKKELEKRAKLAKVLK